MRCVLFLQVVTSRHLLSIIHGFLSIDKKVYSVRTLIPPVLVKTIGINSFAHFILEAVLSISNGIYFVPFQVLNFQNNGFACSAFSSSCTRTFSIFGNK